MSNPEGELNRVLGLFDDVQQLASQLPETQSIAGSDEVARVLASIDILALSGTVALEPPQAEADRLLLRQRAMVEGYLNVFSQEGDFTVPQDDGFELRSHQPRVFMGIGRELRAGPDTHGAIVFGLRGAPNVGKTPIAIKTAQAMGVGKTPEGHQEPTRAVHFVPRVKLGRQVIGNDRQGYAKFAPGLTVGQYFDGQKDQGDVTVITYKSLAAMSEEEFEGLASSNHLFIADEVHRAYGPIIGQRIIRLTRQPNTVFMAMSATMEFNEGRTLETQLGITRMAADIGFREAIEDGMAENAQVCIIATDSTVTTSHTERITEGDVKELITDRSRNELALDLIQSMAEEGRTGIVRCVPGGGSMHARLMAGEAAKRVITDPRTGLRRPLRVEAIGDFRNENDNERLMQAFAEGEVDALTYTKYLIEGYDEDRVEYVADLAPSMSQVDVSQEFGRGMRLKGKLTLYFQFVDKYRGRGSKVWTFLDTLEVERYEPNRVFGKTRQRQPRQAGPSSGSRLSDTPATRGRMEQTAWNYMHLPPRLRASIESIAGKTVAELTVIAKAYEAAPENWLPVSGLSLNEHFSRPTVERILEAREIEIRKGSRGELFVPPGTDELLHDVDTSVADERMVSLADLKAEVGFISSDLFSKMVDELKLVPIMMRTRTKTKKLGWHVSREDAERMKVFLQNEYPPVDPEVDVTVGDVAASLYRNRTQIRMIAGRLQIPLYPKFGPTRRETSCMSREQAKAIIGNLGVLVPSEAVLVSQLAQTLGCTVDDARQAIGESPYAEAKQGGPLRGGEYIDWLMPDMAPAFVEWYRQRSVEPLELPEDTVVRIRQDTETPSEAVAAPGPIEEPAPAPAPTTHRTPQRPTPAKVKPAKRLSQRGRPVDDGAMDPGAIGGYLDLPARSVRAAIDDMERKGMLKGLPAPVVRRLAAGGMAKHYKGATLDRILQELEKRQPK